MIFPFTTALRQAGQFPGLCLPNKHKGGNNAGIPPAGKLWYNSLVGVINLLTETQEKVLSALLSLDNFSVVLSTLI